MSLGFFENENERQINGMVQNNYLISEFINVLTHVEERLPLLNFIQLLNKKNIVTQSIEFSPKSMFMTCLNLLSMPTFTNADFVATQPTSSPSSSAVSFHTTSLIKYMKSLSSELWGLINSCCIRQKHFKDYLTSTLPLVIHAKFIPMGLLSQFTFILEFTFNKELLMLNTSSTNNSKQGDNLSKKQMDVYSVVIDAKSLDLFYDFVKSEWQSMCQIYKLIKELKQAFSKYSELNKQIKIKKLNFKRIVIAYGANFVYTAHVRWSKELKQYDLILGTNEVKHAKSKYDMPLINYQNLFLNEIKKYFFKSQSIINLMQILNLTCTCSYTLAKIISLPKFYARIIPAYAPNMLTLNSTLCLFPSFNLLTCSLTHLRLIYFSRYCLDVHLKANGLVSIRDGSFYLTDINSGIDEFHPIQFLSTFLNLFMDENVEEILRRRSSLVEDDNPSSPPSISMNNASSASAAGGGPLSNNPASSGAANQQPHQFLPPTSPAVQPKATMISNVPTPSPIRENYFAPSPNSFNFGSPAISHNSPQQQQQPQHSVQQQQPATVPQPVTNIPSLSSQSPGGFMSPAPSNIQHQNYSIQSPAANYNDYSMQSPMAQNQMSTKSPFVSGGPMSNTYPNVPSVGAATYENTNTPQQSQPPVQPQQQQQQQQAPQSSASKASANHFNSYLDDNLTTQLSLINHFHYKKYHQAALPIYLSSIGFIKMVTPDSETLYSPLETFLASNHMRKIIIKNLQNDPNVNIFSTFSFLFVLT